MSNLDDFFNKRDKKKKSAKSKFPTLDTDKLAKNLEATAIKTGDDDLDAQDNNNNLTSGTGTTNSAANNDNLDEEWRPYEDENKDLSGLKITFLKQVEYENNDYSGVIDENEKKSACPWGAVNSSSSAHKQYDESNQQDDSNETVQQRQQTALSDSTNQQTNADIQKSSSSTQLTSASAASEQANPGDNNKSDSSNTTSSSGSTSTGGAYVPPALRRQQPDTGKPTPPPASTATTESTNKYVPPGMRNRQAESGSSGGGSSSMNSGIPTTSVNYRRPNKSQPNINDTMEFPTLDAAGTEGSANANDKLSNGAGEKFEMAKKGARVEPKAEGNHVTLANKFTALSSNN